MIAMTADYGALGHDMIFLACDFTNLHDRSDGDDVNSFLTSTFDDIN